MTCEHQLTQTIIDNIGPRWDPSAPVFKCCQCPQRWTIGKTPYGILMNFIATAAPLGGLIDALYAGVNLIVEAPGGQD